MKRLLGHKYYLGQSEVYEISDAVSMLGKSPEKHKVVLIPRSKKHKTKFLKIMTAVCKK